MASKDRDKRKKKRASRPIQGYQFGGVVAGLPVRSRSTGGSGLGLSGGGATTGVNLPGTAVKNIPQAIPPGPLSGDLRTSIGNVPTSFPQIGQTASTLANLGQNIAGSPVSGTVRSGLSQAELSGAPLAALNDLASTGGLVNVDPITQAARESGMAAFGDISDQILQRFAATGGLDSSASIAALARAGEGVSRDIGLEGLRAGVAAQESAQGRRLGSLTPAVNALGIRADALGTLGGLEQAGFGNAIEALRGAGNLQTGQGQLELEARLGQIGAGQDLFNSLIGPGGSGGGSIGGGRMGGASSVYGGALPNITNSPVYTRGGRQPSPQELLLGDAMRGSVFSSPLQNQFNVQQILRGMSGLNTFTPHGFAHGGRVQFTPEGSLNALAQFLQEQGISIGRDLPLEFNPSARIGQGRGQVFGVSPRYQDTEPAFLTPGETVLPAEISEAIASGNMSRDEIVRRVQEFVRKPGGTDVQPGTNVVEPDRNPYKSTVSFESNVRAGLPSPEELGHLRRMQTLLGAAITERPYGQGTPALLQRLQNVTEQLNAANQQILESEALISEDLNRRLERERLNQLEAQRIKEVEEGRKLTERDVASREKLADASVSRAVAMSEDPRRQAMQTLLDESSTPQEQERARAVLGRMVRDENGKRALDILSNKNLSLDQKLELLQRIPGIQASKTGIPGFRNITIERTDEPGPLQADPNEIAAIIRDQLIQSLQE